jgi:homopolymeric O-antigen transport system permease protein
MSNQRAETVDALQTAPTSPTEGALFMSPSEIESATQIVIEPEHSGLGFRSGELWRYRELLYFLIWRDIKVRYKQTLLGAAWAIIQPLFAMLLFTLFFGKLAGVPSDNIPYPLFAYAGLLPWTFFANAVTSSSNSLVGSTSLITKVYFPRVIIPAAAVAAGLVDFAIAFLLLLVLLVYYGISPSWNMLLMPLFIIQTTLLALGVGMWTAALNVKYRDVRYALPFMIQLWLFASPVIYPLSMIPGTWRWVLTLNPMTGIIEGSRASLFGTAFDWAAIAVSVGVTLVVLVYAAYSFRRVEDSFADII